jgi:PAS domain S-box-containing protein/diguanylate cyclase (GGDEF)-like protein
LALRTLKRGGLKCDSRQVQTSETFTRELVQFRPHVILSDFRMPNFDGLSALAIAHERYPDIPFIFVSGTLGEEHAIRTLQNGATDYVLKGNLARLPSAVERALHDAEARALRRAAEAKIHEAELRFQATFEQAAVGISHVSADGRYILVNRRLAATLGYQPEEMVGKHIRDVSHPEDVDASRELRGQLLAGRIDTFTIEKRFLHKQGRTVWMRLTVALMQGIEGQSVSEIAVMEDITERKRADQILKLEHAVASSLADADDAGTALKAIIRTICESEAWDLGRYFALDDAAGVMRFEQAWGKEGAEIEQFIAGSHALAFRPGEGLVGTTWQSGEPLWVADTRRDGRVLQVTNVWTAKLHAAFLIPVGSAGKVVGVLAFSCLEIQEPDARLLQAVKVIGGQVGLFMVRQDQQKHIARLNRIHKVLSGINSLIVRVRSREELFREACRIAVEDGRFSLAWLGIVDRQAIKLDVVALHDTTTGYMELVPLGLEESAPGGLSLAGRVVFERKPLVVNSIETSSKLILREQALERGFRSMAVLPLMDAEGVTGVLSLYADAPDFFDQEEMKLLLELAGDISFAIDHLEKEDQINYLAYYDALTGLANRSLFQERVAHHIDAARALGQRLAVMVVDLERFKLINETLGRSAGDSLLQQIAGRMVGDSPADHARHARIGADQFAVVVPGVDSEEGLARRMEERHETYFGPRFAVGDAELKITARVGVALYPNDGGDAETLLTNAESALKKAKAGSERYLFYTQEMTERVAGRLTLENQLRLALERDEFELYYQPKMHLATRRIEAVEALIRWNSPELGLVPPVQFIPLMEQTGLILEVGAWALRRAVLDYRAMGVLGVPQLRIAVNVSPIQLRRANFIDVVKDAIRDSGSAPGIDLEITESLMMEDIEGNIAKLKAVRALGLNIAIDDFGTGYSSLGYLARLPADYLKIDRSFIISMLEEANTMTLVSTIISLAHSLNLKVIAEGVDSDAQQKILALLRCDQIQGYLISKPLPLQDMLAFTRRWVEGNAQQSR